jgi:hypothetical protein
LAYPKGRQVKKPKTAPKHDLSASITSDFLIKVLGKANLHEDNAERLPVARPGLDEKLIIRTLMAARSTIPLGGFVL